MRIRKNSHRVKTESSSANSTPLQAAIICHLNQSPWDISSTPSSPSLQLEGDNSLLNNNGFGDLFGAVESVASLKLCVDYEEQEEEDAMKINYCSKTDENGNWVCGLEAKQGETFCEFHLRSYIAPVIKKSTTKPSLKTTARAKKTKPESNPYEDVYYYSGSGPSWGKRRVARELSKKSGVVAILPQEGSENSKDSSDGDDEAVDEVKNDDENGKRGRKRIKARSLKSLTMCGKEETMGS